VTQTVADLFVERYRHNRPLFVREVYGAEPDPWQDDLLQRVDRASHPANVSPEPRKIAVKSGHGVGKTTVLAWLIVHQQLTYLPQKAVCTAPTSAQLFDALWADVGVWVSRLPEHLRALLEHQSEKLIYLPSPDESFTSVRTSRAEAPDALQGIHSDRVLLIGDEASGIPDAVFEASVGSMSGHDAVMILTGNPVRRSGLFFRVFEEMLEGWSRMTVSCLDSPRVAPAFVQQIVDDYGIDSNAYRVRVLGEFPLAEDDVYIPWELVEAARTRDIAEDPLVRPIWGLDCARMGDDASVLIKRRGRVVRDDIREWRKKDTMELAGLVKAEWDATPERDRPSMICIDSIGIGAGVADRLREQGLPVFDVNVGELPAIFEEHCLNLRAELWRKMKEWFLQRDVKLPHYNKRMSQETEEWFRSQGLVPELVPLSRSRLWERLQKDITAPTFKFTSSGKLQIEGKAEMKKRLRRSPDFADALVLTFAVDVERIIGGKSAKRAPLRRNVKGLV
jgi:hypothetical protein